MKQLYFFIIVLSLLLSSCGSDSEPQGSIQLSIRDSFLPASIVVNRTDSAIIEECKKFSNQSKIVNAKDELPKDPFGSDKTFERIGFNDQTLLISYYVHTYDILSCNNSFARNYTDKTYDWTISMGTNGDIVDSFNQLIFTRFAILVPKLQKNAELKVLYGVGSYGWDWDK